MGMMQKGLAKAYERQKNSVFEEVAAIGGQVVGFEEFAAEAAGMGKLIGGAALDQLKGKISGGLLGGKETVDGFQVFGFETAGVRHLYVQPYSQHMALPGEHHAWLPGGYRSPIAYRHGMMLWGWDTGGDAELEQWLGTQGALKGVVKQCKTSWSAGTKKFDLEWTVQLISLGDGRSHLVMKAGRYGGLTTYRVGLGHFMSVGSTLAPLLTHNTYPAHSPLYPVHYQDLFHHYILGGQAPSAPSAPPPADPYRNQSAPPAPPAAPTSDYSQAIFQAAGPFANETFFVGHLTGEVEANVRALILPAHQKQAAICVVLDLTVLGSAKDAVVITPDYVYVRELGDTMGFSLDDLATVEPPKGMLTKTVKAHLKSGRVLKVPCGSNHEGLYAVLAQCAG
ncbi:MAG: hypothetical protein AAGE52_16135 [Myxococcota bacterium]